MDRGRTLQPTKRAGLSVRASAYGWTCCFTLASDGRCRAPRTPACARWCRHQDGKERLHDRGSGVRPAGAASHPGRRSPRGFGVHRWRQRSAPHKRNRSETSSGPRARRLACRIGHGVRKLAATRMVNNGATEAQLMAVFGWTDPKMAAHYTRSANRRRLAAQSIGMMLNAAEHLFPHLRIRCGRRTKRQIKPMPNFESGGPGRARTSNQTVMSRRL